MEGLEKGNTITCQDEEDLIETMDDLSDAGYGAVRMSPYSSFMIWITSVPEKDGERDRDE